MLGALGRWSLLDVFVTLVLIVLAHNQGQLFVTDVKSGLLMFMTAIVLAMLTGDVVHHLHDRATRLPVQEVKLARDLTIPLLSESLTLWTKGGGQAFVKVRFDFEEAS